MMGVEFGKVAPYLQDPLILIGFVLLLMFGLARTLIKSRLLTPVSGAKTYRVIQTVLVYGLVVALAVIGLGFGLKYRELSETEQQNAVGLLRREMDANLVAVEAIRKNTMVMLNIVSYTAMAVRTPDVKVMAALFPVANVQAGDKPHARDMAVDALVALSAEGLNKNADEMARANQLADVLRSTLDRTRPTVMSLSDPERRRYVISEAAWQANLPILRKVHVAGIPEIQDAYATSRMVRSDYDVVCASVIAYMDALQPIVAEDGEVNVDTLSAALSQERQTLMLLNAYGMTLADSIAKLERARGVMRASVVSI
jgi:hypothetical protein